MRKLVDLQYSRNDLNLVRGTFRVRGDTLEVFPADDERALRVEFFGDEVDRIVRVDTLTGEVGKPIEETAIFPASHYVSSRRRSSGRWLDRGRARRAARRARGRGQAARGAAAADAHQLRPRDDPRGRVLQRHRELLAALRRPGAGEAPYTLLDYFPDDFVVFIDESHVTVPQIGGMYEGDRSRKDNLVEHGFRLPSARDNRPLTFDEFLERIGQRLFISATPGPTSGASRTRSPSRSSARPAWSTPRWSSSRPPGQIDDLMEQIRQRTEADQRVLVTTLTKKMAEDLTDYLLENGVRVRYLHSDIDTVERVEILRSLRLGEFDVLVGINLLREGLDLPEVSLVAILDADKEGFLRSGDLADPDHRPRGPQRRRPGRDVRRPRHRLDARRSTRPTGAARSSSPTTPSTASTRRRSASASATSSPRCGPRSSGGLPPRRRAGRRAATGVDVGELPTEELGRADPAARGGDARGGRRAALRVRRPPARRGRRPQAPTSGPVTRSAQTRTSSGCRTASTRP
jgi:transcription-repair coupling factor (superfamily II helicase)